MIDIPNLAPRPERARRLAVSSPLARHAGAGQARDQGAGRLSARRAVPTSWPACMRKRSATPQRHHRGREQARRRRPARRAGAEAGHAAEQQPDVRGGPSSRDAAARHQEPRLRRQEGHGAGRAHRQLLHLPRRAGEFAGEEPRRLRRGGQEGSWRRPGTSAFRRSARSPTS